MEQLILNVKNKSKLNLLIELVKHLDFVEVAEAPQLSNKEKKILKNLETAVEDVNLHKKGKKKLKSLEQVLDEL
jgi:hypothetical protein